VEVRKSAAVGHDNMDWDSKDSEEPPQQELRTPETDQAHWRDYMRMEAEVEDAVGGGGVEERKVVKELVAVQQADQALPHGKLPHCSPVPELGHQAHILGFVDCKREEEVRNDETETCYGVGKGASLNTGSSNCGSDFSVQGSPREQKGTH